MFMLRIDCPIQKKLESVIEEDNFYIFSCAGILCNYTENKSTVLKIHFCYLFDAITDIAQIITNSKKMENKNLIPTLLLFEYLFFNGFLEEYIFKLHRTHSTFFLFFSNKPLLIYYIQSRTQETDIFSFTW